MLTRGMSVTIAFLTSLQLPQPLGFPREYSRMRLTEILKPQNIKVPLVSTGKSDAIGELVQLLADNKEVSDAKKSSTPSWNARQPAPRASATGWPSPTGNALAPIIW